MDIIIFIIICLFVKWFVSEWKMAGQKPVQLFSSCDGKEKPWDNAMREKYGTEYYNNLKKEWSKK